MMILMDLPRPLPYISLTKVCFLRAVSPPLLSYVIRKINFLRFPENGHYDIPRIVQPFNPMASYNLYQGSWSFLG